MRCFGRLVLSMLIGIGVGTLSGCKLIAGPPRKVLTALERLPKATVTHPDVPSRVTIKWDRHAVPFVVSETDEGAFFGLGYAHAHLRLGQMALTRLAVAGRLAELVGPLATSVDVSLRILNIGRAADSIVANLSDEERALVKAFVDGVNLASLSASRDHIEFNTLGLPNEPWSMRDVVAVSRLASIDFSWLILASILSISDGQQREEAWAQFRALRDSTLSDQPTATISSTLSSFSSLAALTGRLGSNSAVVAGRKTSSGAPLIISDPHLGVSLPNFWLIAAVCSPRWQAVGLMIPGVPFFALGRNANGAWGGTNLRALSSALFDVSGVVNSSRAETIHRRWWWDKTVTVRETEFGPIISDSPLFEGSESTPIALSWLGHRGDGGEFRAFLNLARVGSWAEFRRNFRRYLVPGLSMLYAGSSGEIGGLFAYSQPQVDPNKLLQALSPLSVREQEDLPVIHNPPEGYIVSTNDELVPLNPPASLLPPTSTRGERFRELINELAPLSLGQARTMQRDTVSLSGRLLARTIARRLDGIADLTAEEAKLRDEFATWNGSYTKDSVVASLLENCSLSLAEELDRILGGTESLTLWQRSGLLRLYLLQQMTKIPDAALRQAVRSVTSRAARRPWGELQQLRLSHPLGNIPVIGIPYRVLTLAAPGTDDSIHKSGSTFSPDGMLVRYGSQARHISDLSNLDENYFVLLGGQDGVFTSPLGTDQVSLWEQGDYIRVPLTHTAFATEKTTTLQPQ